MMSYTVNRGERRFGKAPRINTFGGLRSKPSRMTTYRILRYNWL